MKGFLIRVVGLSVVWIMSGMQTGFGITYYSRGSGSWSNSLKWSTVGYGNATNIGTFPKAGDIAYVGNGHSMKITATTNACANLVIGQGASGMVYFPAGTNVSLTISGNLTINTGGILNIESGSPSVHALNLTGNLINNGLVDLRNSNGGNKYVNLNFTGNSNSLVTGTGSWALYFMTMDKTIKTNALEIQSAGFSTALSILNFGFLGVLLKKGSFIHNVNDFLNYLNNTRYKAEVNAAAVAADVDVVGNVSIEVRLGTVKLATDTDNVINLFGDLLVTGGTLEIGGTTGMNGGIKYKTPASGTARLTVSSGTVNCYGSITCATATDPLDFSLSGGIINTNLGYAVSNFMNFYVNDVASSLTNITGGVINIKRNNSISSASFKLNGSFPANATVTGGTVVFGNSSTAYNYLFFPFSGINYPHIQVAGKSGTVLKATHASDFIFLSLIINNGNTFDFSPTTFSTLRIVEAYDGLRAFRNSGFFLSANGNVNFCGPMRQCICGDSITNFFNLTIDNTSGVLLEQWENVINKLYLTNGELELNQNTLTIINPAKTAIERLNTAYVKSETNVATNPSIIKWKIGTDTGTYIFPFGVTATGYIPVTFIKQTPASSEISLSTRGTSGNNLPFATGSTLNDYFSIDRSDIVIDRWWDISSTLNPLPSPGANLTFSYEASENTLLPINLRTGLIQIQHWNDSLNNWDFPFGGNTGDTISVHTVSGVGATDFSPFILVAGPSPLAVDLLYFEAVSLKSKVVLKWETASEINNNYFLVERSVDGKSFSQIGNVPGQGNSNNLSFYEFEDLKPNSGINYYRIAQVDFDNKYSYSEIKAVEFFNEFSIRIKPNPIDEMAGIFFNGKIEPTYKVNLFNLLGQPLRGFEAAPINNMIILDLSDYAPGIYSILIKTRGEVYHERIIKK